MVAIVRITVNGLIGTHTRTYTQKKRVRDRDRVYLLIKVRVRACAREFVYVVFGPPNRVQERPRHTTAKMGLRRPGVIKDYEEMPGANVPPGGRVHVDMTEHHAIGAGAPIMDAHQHNGGLGQEFEMASVSVVPDGKTTRCERHTCRRLPICVQFDG